MVNDDIYESRLAIFKAGLVMQIKGNLLFVILLAFFSLHAASSSYAKPASPREIFGIKIGDNVENYTYNKLTELPADLAIFNNSNIKKIEPPNPLKTISSYYILKEKNNRITRIYAKGQFNSFDVCIKTKREITNFFKSKYDIKTQVRHNPWGNSFTVNDDTLSLSCWSSLTDKGKFDLYIDYSSILSLPTTNELFGVSLNKEINATNIDRVSNYFVVNNYAVPKPNSTFQSYHLLLDENKKVVWIGGFTKFDNKESCLIALEKHHQRLDSEYQMQMIRSKNYEYGWQNANGNFYSKNKADMLLTCRQNVDKYSLALSLNTK